MVASENTPLPEATMAFRHQFRSERIGPRYNGWAHFAFTTLASLAVIAAAISQVRDVLGPEWLAIPASFFIANLAEYLGHRGPMHRRKRFAGILYRRHSLEHHRFFVADAMTFESPADFKITLFPPAMLIFFLGMLATPIAVLLFLVATENIAWMFVAVAMGYFLTYEWLHFAYHLPEDTPIGRLPWMPRLRRHHTRHHDPRLMSRHNFNITFPLCDFLFRTRYRPDAGADAAAEKPGPATPSLRNAEPPS